MQTVSHVVGTDVPIPGVLRGERARFQLFGDTVNTAARIQATSHPGMIQVSSETARLLTAHGKQDWLLERKDVVTLKGKGETKTFWLTFSDRGDTESVNDVDVGEKALSLATDKVSGLIAWNVEVLSRHLKQIVASHRAQSSTRSMNVTETSNGHPIDEVVEVVTLPEKPCKISEATEQEVELGPEVTEQLESFVTNIAALYCENPFHNFEHASRKSNPCNRALLVFLADFD